MFPQNVNRVEHLRNSVDRTSRAVLQWQTVTYRVVEISHLLRNDKFRSRSFACAFVLAFRARKLHVPSCGASVTLANRKYNIIEVSIASLSLSLFLCLCLRLCLAGRSKDNGRGGGRRELGGVGKERKQEGE